jgi:1-acyl-sn-glycerol-3-phosphate acyltransferase
LSSAETSMLLVRSVLFAVAFYATTAVMLIGGLWLLAAPRRWAMAGLKLHGRVSLKLLAWICGTRLEVRGRERIPQGACLVAAKHQSAWDTFALVTLFDDAAIVLKDELKFIPVYGWFCLKFEHLLVKRERAAVALRHLVADAKSRVAAGRQVLIFPEGTRRSLLRHPGTIVVEILEPIAPGLPRAEFRKVLEQRLETVSGRLAAEGRAGANATHRPGSDAIEA